MKEQNYKQHIQGMPLDKIQEGSFEYEAVKHTTLSQYAKMLRDQVNSKSASNLIVTGRDKL